MRIRFWLGLTAVLLVGIGSAAAALIVHLDDQADFHEMQRDEATRSARQAEAVADLSIGQLASAAAFFQAKGDFNEHEFNVIAKPLLRQGALSGTAFIQHVPAARRHRFESRRGLGIFTRGRGGFRPSPRRQVYYPVVFGATDSHKPPFAGYDLAGDPKRLPFLRRARDLGRPVATEPVPLLIGGLGVNVYRPVYRDGAPIGTRAQRRAALIGFVAGAFLVEDLAGAALATVPDTVDVQVQVQHNTVFGEAGTLDDSARAPIQIADRTWVLVVRDPKRPDVSLPLLLAGIGISLAALLGALILVWSRNERMQELEREASQDSLTGLKNRRRFEEDLAAAVARSRREGTTGGLLMLDLDHFKQVNDTLGHPAGDRLIREVAMVLRSRARETDALARLGGDEFALVLPNCSLAEAQIVAEAIASAVREHRPAVKGAPPVTASIGIAMFGPGTRTDPDLVAAAADAAMYAAKDAGRDRVQVFAGETVPRRKVDGEMI